MMRHGNPYIAQQRLTYFADMLRATGWTEVDGGWLAPEHFRERLAAEVGRGSLHLWTALAAQVQFDQALIAAHSPTDTTPSCRADTGEIGHVGECLLCNADQGEACRRPARQAA